MRVDEKIGADMDFGGPGGLATTTLSFSGEVHPYRLRIANASWNGFGRQQGKVVPSCGHEAIRGAGEATRIKVTA